MVGLDPRAADGDNGRALREQIRPGQIVEGIVVDHREFGGFADLGGPDCLGLVELPNIDDHRPRWRGDIPNP